MCFDVPSGISFHTLYFELILWGLHSSPMSSCFCLEGSQWVWYQWPVRLPEGLVTNRRFFNHQTFWELTFAFLSNDPTDPTDEGSYWNVWWFMLVTSMEKHSAMWPRRTKLLQQTYVPPCEVHVTIVCWQLSSRGSITGRGGTHRCRQLSHSAFVLQWFHDDPWNMRDLGQALCKCHSLLNTYVARFDRSVWKHTVYIYWAELWIRSLCVQVKRCWKQCLVSVLLIRRSSLQ